MPKRLGYTGADGAWPAVTEAMKRGLQKRQACVGRGVRYGDDGLRITTPQNRLRDADGQPHNPGLPADAAHPVYAAAAANASARHRERWAAEEERRAREKQAGRRVLAPVFAPAGGVHWRYWEAKGATRVRDTARARCTARVHIHAHVCQGMRVWRRHCVRRGHACAYARSRSRRHIYRTRTTVHTDARARTESERASERERERERDRDRERDRERERDSAYPPVHGHHQRPCRLLCPA
jgi:hypothetical protein